MAKVVSNSLRVINRTHSVRSLGFRRTFSAARETVLARNAKVLAWTIFLIFFIENGTLGLLPRQFYFVYRNVRISDLLIYAVIIYSFFCVKEYQDYLKSRSLITVKLILLYLVLHFIASVIIYEVNFVEYFFRLKLFWTSFMIFPYLLLLKRNALNYLIKLIFPFSVVSNILYIITAMTGIALLPDIHIVKTTFVGGIEVYRVFGGTFLGDLLFLGLIYNWVSVKFKPYQLIFAVVFILPHILALGRGAWIYFLTVILFILVFNSLKKKKFKAAIRQVAIIFVLFVSVILILTSFIPESENIVGALGERVLQGESDIKYNEGTYGSRGVSQSLLLEYWSKNNIFLGIGMHPFWVIKPETKDEYYYAIGYSDLTWAPFLVSYGIIGFTIAIIFQISYLLFSLKILKKETKMDLLSFFILVFFATLFFDSFIYFTFVLISVGTTGFSLYRGFLIAAIVFKYEQHFASKETP